VSQTQAKNFMFPNGCMVQNSIKNPDTETQARARCPNGLDVYEYRNGLYAVAPKAEGGRVFANWTRFEQSMPQPKAPLDYRSRADVPRLIQLSTAVNIQLETIMAMQHPAADPSTSQPDSRWQPRLRHQVFP